MEFSAWETYHSLFLYLKQGLDLLLISSSIIAYLDLSNILSTRNSKIAGDVAVTEYM